MVQMAGSVGNGRRHPVFPRHITHTQRYYIDTISASQTSPYLACIFMPLYIKKGAVTHGEQPATKQRNKLNLPSGGNSNIVINLWTI